MRKVEVIYQKQKEYGYIKSVDIFRNICGEECSQYNMKLSLVDFPCWDGDEHFDILFEGISNIKIGDIDNLFKVFIQIEYIAEYQYETAKYVVKECENELFSFLCKDIKIL